MKQKTHYVMLNMELNMALYLVDVEVETGIFKADVVRNILDLKL